jgi:hypothetical protein
LENLLSLEAVNLTVTDGGEQEDGDDMTEEVVAAATGKRLAFRPGVGNLGLKYDEDEG